MRMPTLSDIELLERKAIQEARDRFWAYRQYMRPGMKLGWWQRLIARELQRFHEELTAGEKPILVIEAPPQHGKSETIVDFIQWVAGKNPDLRTIYTSYSERLGVRANLACQRAYDSEKFKKIFPETQINEPGLKYEENTKSSRNRELIEYIGKEGCFRNTTVRGRITGEGLDLGVIDDPIKGRKEAGSDTVRNDTWEWFTDDFFTRFSEDAGLLTILTRWHIDDPVGRLKQEFGSRVKVVSFPAIAEEDEHHRNVGDALFPELKSLDFLLERKSIMASFNWESLYQQNPQIQGGEIFHGEDFGRYKILPHLEYRMIYADTAQKKKESNDYTTFECWGKGVDGRIYLIDVKRKRMTAPELRRAARDFWNKHADQEAYPVAKFGNLRAMKVEDKTSGTGLIQELTKKQDIDGSPVNPIPVVGIPRSTDKYTRALDVVGYCESGYVLLPDEAPWVDDFIDECEAFTADDSHMFDDQVDPMMDAITDMLTGSNFTQLLQMAVGG